MAGQWWWCWYDGSGGVLGAGRRRAAVNWQHDDLENSGAMVRKHGVGLGAVGVVGKSEMSEYWGQGCDELPSTDSITM